MNKAKLNKRLNNLEAEAEKLRELINAPDVCEPEAGDVWESNTGNLWHVNTDLSAICLKSSVSHWREGDRITEFLEDAPMMSGGMKYIGKHSEVFVRISDVRDALSHEDEESDSVFTAYIEGLFDYGTKKSQEALRKLNII